MKLETNSRRRTEKYTNMRELENTLLNNQYDKGKIGKKLENIFRNMTMNIEYTKTYNVQEKQY